LGAAPSDELGEIETALNALDSLLGSRRRGDRLQPLRGNASRCAQVAMQPGGVAPARAAAPGLGGAYLLYAPLSLARPGVVERLNALKPEFAIESRTTASRSKTS
jgi:hypothetical protein